MSASPSTTSFRARPYDYAEARLIADELGLAGTITELTLASDVDGFAMRQDGVLAQVRARYVQAMRRDITLPGLNFVTMSRDRLLTEAVTAA